jgi:acetyl esterase
MTAKLRKRVRVRKKLGSMVATGFFTGLSKAGAMTPWSSPDRHGVEVIKDIPYAPGGDPAHTLDVYRPVDWQGDHPVLLYIHGGGFRILSKDSHWMFGLAFAKRGFVVFNINYRLAPQHPFPAALEDAAKAYAWVAENAHLYGGDVDRLYVAGESAGGNLTCGMTIAACYDRPEPYLAPVRASGVIPKGALPACAFLDVHNLEHFEGHHIVVQDRAHEIKAEYYDRGRFTHDDEHEIASPIYHFEKGERPARPLPPFFVPCGTRDPVIADSRRLRRALEALDVEVHQPEYAGQPHAFHALLWKETARACIRDHYDFLDRAGAFPDRDLG